MIRTVMKVLFSLGVGFVAALLVQVLGGALLFGGFFKRPQFWTQLQITGMSVVAALAGFVGATVATLSARRLQVRRAEWLVLPFLIFPGIPLGGYHTVKDFFSPVAFAATN